MNDKVTGIILNVSEYKENDQLLQVLCQGYGLLSFIARGSMKISSHHHYMPLSVYEFIIDFKERRDIFIPRGCKLLKTYYDDSMIELLAFKNILTSVLLKNKELLDDIDYEELIFVLDNINNDNKYLLGSLFFAYLLKKHGLSPMVDGCVECGEQEIIGLSNKKGGFLCKKHCIENDIVSVETLKRFRLINKASKENYELIKDYKYDKTDFFKEVEFYLENTGLDLPAYTFYKSL